MSDAQQKHSMLEADKASHSFLTLTSCTLICSFGRLLLLLLLTFLNAGVFTVLLQVPQFCAVHRDKATMVNKVSPRCTAEGCNRAATFGRQGSKVSVN